MKNTSLLAPKVVILAAGVGSRIRPLTDDCPKRLLTVADTTILERMIRNCLSAGLSEFIVVLVYLDEQIRTFVAKTFPELDVTFVLNEKYGETNSGYSLMLAAEALDGAGFIKFDADVVFDVQILNQLIRSPHDNALCIDRAIQLDAEEVKVITGDAARVLQASKTVDPDKAAGESIGIEKISAATARSLFSELSDMMAEPAHHQDYYEAAYERLMTRGTDFHALDITGLNWTEIGTHEGFAQANAMFRQPAKPAVSAKPAQQQHRHLLRAGAISGFRR